VNTLLLLVYALIIFLAVVTSVLFKLGVMENGPTQWNLDYWLRFIFHPFVFLSFLTAFIARMIRSLPLQTIGIARLNLVLTPLGLAAIMIASSLIFKESFTKMQWIGVFLAFLALFFLEAGSE
jgi:multidrug transporter EmrE-like cation transporter